MNTVKTVPKGRKTVTLHCNECNKTIRLKLTEKGVEGKEIIH